MTLYERLKDVIVHRIIGVADTPHRIAWGVFIGCVIAFSPTFGAQIMLYVLTATLLGANKISGIPVLFVTNPFTIVPIYYAEWWFGSLLLGQNSAGQHLPEALRDPGHASSSEIGHALLEAGGGLIVGSLIVGVLVGAVGYAVTYWSVIAFRRARASSPAQP